MKKIYFIIILMLCSAGILFSQHNFPALSIAGTDDFLASRINPAALAFHHQTNLAFMGYYGTDFDLEKDSYSFLINFPALGYIYDHTPNGDNHSLLFSSRLFRNFYLGSSFKWRNDIFAKGEASEYLLYRPFDFVSFGTGVTDIFGDNSPLRVGVAVRPLYFQGKFWDRLNCSIDMDYRDEKWHDPILGITTEFADGIILGGSYDLESENIGINLSVRFDNISTGSLASFNKDRELQAGNFYLNLSGKKFRSLFLPPQKRDFYEFPLKGDILEKEKGFQLGPITIISGKDRTIGEIIADLKKMQEDDRVGGILFKQANFGASYAQMLELRDALLEFKSAGKSLIYYYEHVSNMNYVLAASTGDAIYLNPMGEIDLKGISVSVPYISGLLDTLGIDVYNLRSHDFKTAGNMFSESEMTESEREAYTALLEDYFHVMCELIEEGRGARLISEAADIIDKGPFFLAADAENNGLVDGLLYEDQIEETLKSDHPRSKIHKKYFDDLARVDWSEPARTRIAVIYAIGNIHSGEGIPGSSIGSETTARAIRNARKDKSIEGIILRVDSGGGSALASDVISREIELCTRGENRKPVVVSMSGMAASGGYYISTMADHIIAQPLTITGSIGVLAVIPNLERLYDKIHINWSTVKKGDQADIFSLSRKMSDHEKEMIEKSIKDCYGKFVATVAAGRGMSEEDVHAVAQGRVWTGKQALDRGLIDSLGGMKEALTIMKKLKNSDREIELIEFAGKEQGLTIKMGLGDSALKIPLVKEMNKLISISKKFADYGDEKILMVLPYDLEVE